MVFARIPHMIVGSADVCYNTAHPLFPTGIRIPPLEIPREHELVT